MSSWAGAQIDGMAILETQNYYSEWYFHKTDRLINEVDALQYYDEMIFPSESKVKSYIYKTNASTLRRRLELDGHNRISLEQEFKEQLKQLIKDLNSMQELAPERVTPYIEAVKSSCIDDWLKCLLVIKNKKTISEAQSKVDHNQTLMGFMHSLDTYFSDSPTPGDFHFPCLTEEGYAVALLEISSDNAECLLDVTGLVIGGWTEDFNDIIEYRQESTTFFQVFSTSINDIRDLMLLAPENSMLARLLYASVITAMETYLSDTFKKQVLNREPLKRRFIKNHDHFKNKKICISDIFEKLTTLNDEIVIEIDKMSFHNLERTSGIYKSVLSTEFPAALISELTAAISIRHDIIHRNGKNTDSKPTVIKTQDIDRLIATVTATTHHIDKQIKDGLLD